VVNLLTKRRKIGVTSHSKNRTATTRQALDCFTDIDEGDSNSPLLSFCKDVVLYCSVSVRTFKKCYKEYRRLFSQISTVISVCCGVFDCKLFVKIPILFVNYFIAWSYLQPLCYKTIRLWTLWYVQNQMRRTTRCAHGCRCTNSRSRSCWSTGGELQKGA